MTTFGGFPVVERDQWVQLAAGTLVRGRLGADDDPEQLISRLQTTTYDGIVIEPLYSAGSESTNDGEVSEQLGYPGFTPFVRGRTAVGARSHGWDVRQRVDATAPAGTAVAELERGATSLWLDLRGAETVDDTLIGTALEGVYLDLTSVTLDAGDRWTVAADALLARWTSTGVASAAATGSFGADPIGDYASAGGAAHITADITANIDVALAAVGEFAGRVSCSHPGVRIVAVDATRFHDAGASDGQELGFGIAVAVGYLRALEAAGIELATAFRQIELRFAATTDQFSTIAKFRAARRLWARIADVAGIAPAAGATPIHAVTSSAMLTRYDPWVNLLRGTIACFGAGLGGADAITVNAYDAMVHPAGTELGRRLARNTQAILAKESNLSQVLDPAGGSWYVERLTQQLAEVAWERFQRIEALGGMIAAVDTGVVADDIAATWQARRHNIVTRRDPLTGVSEYPNIAELIPPLGDAAPTMVANGARDEHRGSRALVLHRYSEPFELLRERVDHLAGGTGSRPAVFLANLGAPIAHAARASFAKNLFEIGGLVTVGGAGSTDPDEIAEQYAASGAQAACLCSSDRMYADLGVPVAAALAVHEPAFIFVAGEPRDVAAELTEAGVEGFVTSGADVEQILSDVLQRLGVP